jgi:hypothetical protein
MGLGTQYLRLLWQVRHIADNTSKYLRYLLKETRLSMTSVASHGEIWVFFTFNAAHSGEWNCADIGEFRLGEDLSGLPLVLGLRLGKH